MLPALIFDLDGTLTDSKPGILGCLRKVLDERGMGDQGPLDRFIGPPVEEWVVDLLPNGSEEERVALARDYRACYDREGWRNNSVFPGVREMLVELHRAGLPALRLHLQACSTSPCASSTPSSCRRSSPPSTATRPNTQATAKSICSPTSCASARSGPDSAWMIGDRSFDIDAAHANRLRCLAAGWGYGTPEECAQADAVAATPADVAALVLPAASRPSRQRLLLAIRSNKFRLLAAQTAPAAAASRRRIDRAIPERLCNQRPAACTRVEHFHKPLERSSLRSQRFTCGKH